MILYVCVGVDGVRQNIEEGVGFSESAPGERKKNGKNGKEEKKNCDACEFFMNWEKSLCILL